MKGGTVAGRIAWSFAAVFCVGLLIISAAAYYELQVETDSMEHPMTAGLELVGEALVCVGLLSLGGRQRRRGGAWRVGQEF